MSKSHQTPEASAGSQHGLVLTGLDGSNPLGFLAALGLLRVLDSPTSLEGLRMSWRPFGGTWIPAIHHVSENMPDEGAILDSLSRRLAGNIKDHPAELLTQLSAASEDQLDRRSIMQSVVEGTDTTLMDWNAAIASDFAAPEAISQLQTTRRDYFYGNLASVIGRTKLDDLRRAIFQPWDYGDALDNQSLHLDPSEDRRHAYQWNKPAGDPDRKTRGGMLGANRLALEAIPLFPSFPEDDALRTVGFTGTRSTNTRWTWPIWSVALSLPVIRSLLASSFLQGAIFDADGIASLRAQGIVAVFRSSRILVEKTPNFAPAKCVA
jgi:CRISPR-associated endonuclease/helicase Cas3